MREAKFMGQVDTVSAALPVSGRGPFADTIEREDRRFRKGRRKEGTGSMRFVVFGEHAPFRVLAAQPSMDLSRHMQLLFEP